MPSLWPIVYHLTTMFLCLFSLINCLAFHLLRFLLLLELMYCYKKNTQKNKNKKTHPKQTLQKNFQATTNIILYFLN